MLDHLIKREFPIIDCRHHLNHAAVAPWPRRTADAVKTFADENLNIGSSNYAHWMQIENSLRSRCAQIIGAPDQDSIAFLKNTSEGLSFVAYGFPWQQGDNVVISDQEFPSNRIVWESLADSEVEVRQVALPCSTDIESAIMSACNKRTRMISISAVQYASGMRIDLQKLGGLCKRQGVALCVDAIQALGAIPIDVATQNIDFLVADGHKWLLGPEGLAIFYCSKEWRNQLRLHEFGWRMIENPSDFDQKEWRPSPSGSRFECGSPNMIGIHALNESLGLLLEIGLDVVERRVLERTEYLFEQISERSDLELLSCREPGRYAGITVFRSRHYDNEELFRRLNEANVLCAVRGGGIRFSPHFYTPLESLDFALDLVSG